jgi:putative protease
MELLAPVGSPEHFGAAAAAGADAFYLGVPALSARDSPRELSFSQIDAIIQAAHDRGGSVYLALNRLVRASETKLLIEALATIDQLGADGLIVQDIGVLAIVRHHFPHLRLHASTLMGGYNLDNVKMLAGLGCSRVVLARELSLDEIGEISRRADVELEVFIHGAMCYSISGLCYFSSYHGGKSALRGQCVQPCRRRYEMVSHGAKTAAKAKSSKSGYFFSMNDLEGIRAVPALKGFGVSALKIEGRLRSAAYVENVVRAYRLLIDADESDYGQAEVEATRLLDRAMGRNRSPGYFASPTPPAVLSVHHSGNTGHHLGSIIQFVTRQAKRYGELTLKQPCSVGDRLRIHFEKSGERTSFRLREMVRNQESVTSAEKGETVSILMPAEIATNRKTGKVELYRTDCGQIGEKKEVKLPRLGDSKIARHGNIDAKVSKLQRMLMPNLPIPSEGAGRSQPPRKRAGRQPEIWLRVDRVEHIPHRPGFAIARYLVDISAHNIAGSAKLKQLTRGNQSGIIWALPPLLFDKGRERLKKQIVLLRKSGFRAFQIAHLGQIELCGESAERLYGDFSLNLMNQHALASAFSFGLHGCQLSIELGQEESATLMAGYTALARSRYNRAAVQQTQQSIGMTIYGAPPLFTARIADKTLASGKTVRSPRNEQLSVERRDGLYITRSKTPFSLIPHISQLGAMGVDYLVIDIRGLAGGKTIWMDLAKQLSGNTKVGKRTAFNYFEPETRDNSGNRSPVKLKPRTRKNSLQTNK